MEFLFAGPDDGLGVGTEKKPPEMVYTEGPTLLRRLSQATGGASCGSSALSP